MDFHFDPNGVDSGCALIYMWEIRAADDALVGRYVGKSKNGADRPLKDYKKNVINLLSGKPYRKSKPDSFRRIHRALAEAAQKGHRIALTFLANVDPGEDINAAEQRFILEQQCAGPHAWQLNGQK